MTQVGYLCKIVFTILINYLLTERVGKEYYKSCVYYDNDYHYQKYIRISGAL
jgi:hypothetical protein